MTIPFKLGYKQKSDPRDARYPLSALMAVSPPVTQPVSKVWKPGDVNNQGDTNGCVGFSCFKFQTSEPYVLTPPLLTAEQIYAEARDNDEWTETGSETDSGTSVRAGLNVLRRHGVIDSFYWADSADEVFDFVLKYGPVVLGTPWYEGFFHPDAAGFIHMTGMEVGGHAWFAYACDWKERALTFRNSWTEDWGRSGDARISLNDLRELFNRGATAAAVLEV